eukprot:4568335-Pyramimonas_sp.AAC.1
MRTCAVAPTRTTWGKEEEEKEEEEEEENEKKAVEVEEEGGGKNVAFDYPHFCGVVSSCPQQIL